MDKTKVVVLLSLIFLTITPQMAGSAATAEVRPKLAGVVYITASRICECSQELCLRGDQIITQIFVGERQRLLRIIDLSKDLQAAEPYVRKLDRAFQLPTVVFMDAKDQILWHTGGELSKGVILGKLKEFGVN